MAALRPSTFQLFRGVFRVQRGHGFLRLQAVDLRFQILYAFGVFLLLGLVQGQLFAERFDVALYGVNILLRLFARRLHAVLVNFYRKQRVAHGLPLFAHLFRAPGGLFQPFFGGGNIRARLLGIGLELPDLAVQRDHLGDLGFQLFHQFAPAFAPAFLPFSECRHSGVQRGGLLFQFPQLFEAFGLLF